MASRGPLGHCWGPLGASWRPLGAKARIVGSCSPSWALIGAVLGPCVRRGHVADALFRMGHWT
eukprot:6298885-Pyramimonas_sp.AAC.1